jgi:hypothetical protein
MGSSIKGGRIGRGWTIDGLAERAQMADRGGRDVAVRQARGPLEPLWPVLGGLPSKPPAQRPLRPRPRG